MAVESYSYDDKLTPLTRQLLLLMRTVSHFAYIIPFSLLSMIIPTFGAYVADCTIELLALCQLISVNGHMHICTRTGNYNVLLFIHV